MQREKVGNGLMQSGVQISDVSPAEVDLSLCAGHQPAATQWNARSLQLQDVHVAA